MFLALWTIQAYALEEAHHHPPPDDVLMINQKISDMMTKIFPPQHHEWLEGVVYDGDESECHKCVMDGAKYVVNEKMDEIAKWCKGEEPKKIEAHREFCELLERSPQVVVGMVIFWTKPLGLGFAYCLGKGECKMEDGAAESLDIQVPATEWYNINGTSIVQAMEMNHGSLRGGHKECMERCSKGVMHHVIERVKKFCRETKCPKAQKLCDFAGKHRELAYGYLLAMTEPWKFASGYCWPHEKMVITSAAEYRIFE